MLDYEKAVKIEYKLKKLLKITDITIDISENWFGGKKSYKIIYDINSKEYIKKINELESTYPSYFMLISNKFLHIYSNKINVFIKDIKTTDEIKLKAIVKKLQEKIN